MIMSIGEGTSKLRENTVGLDDIHCLTNSLQLIQPMFERSPINKLHHNVKIMVIFASIMDSYNVRMRKPRHQLRLLIETLYKIAVSRKPWRQNLDRDFAIKVLLTRFIDTSHTPLAEGY